NCTVIIGSATNPKALTSNIGWNKYPTEIEEIKHQYEDSELNRYSINYFAERINLSKFALESVEFLRNNNTRSVMFVLNTKESARLLFDYIKDNFSCENVYFLSSAVTHKDRKKILSKIFERKEKRILICTQVIEAGVDITFDVVFRDLAPLDSIVQVAGRCNRYNEEKGEVNIVELTKPESENLVYCTMVYDPILIEQTRFILKKTKKIDEIRLSSVIEKYYEILTNEGNRKDTKRAVEEYNNLFFESLSEEFKLIDEQENDTLIICKNSAEMIKLISKADMMNRKDIFTEFRVKAISMSKRAIERIKEKVSSTSITIIIDSDYASIWAVSLEENNWLYQENGGLNIPELNDTTPLQKLD
ncbi:MAG: hypothetical protein KAU62_14055, partial [Candidatus Heimdallarchaeota archaeon]|nr:hypothetical protein [Candidatus Heimdallarchaeota archaeon]MCK4612275.1 hypothetical protein [Candidatus Heimdallarchaeota archaeon]